MVGQRAGGFCRDGGGRSAPARQCLLSQRRRMSLCAAADCRVSLSVSSPAAAGRGALPELLTNEAGLILVTGATGSGKSTTLAAMVDFLNRHALTAISSRSKIRWNLSTRASVA